MRENITYVISYPIGWYLAHVIWKIKDKFEVLFIFGQYLFQGV